MQTTLYAREYATLDRAGRVQLPRKMTRRLGRAPARLPTGPAQDASLLPGTKA